MDEVQIKHELAGLEQRILGITGDPLDYQHYRRFLDWSRNEMKVNEIEELMSDRCLILNLLFGCHCTPGEVERLEKVNDLLLEMTNRTYHRTADLVRALLVMNKDDMDDGSTWAEGPLRNPKLEHIIVCHALHALCTHMSWSIPDVLRINDLSIEVRLTIQQFSDQERNRLDWCRNYDLQHFKEVLLKEAADRPEGVSLENALLQRCRDHFEDIADEILDKVGLSDIDLYLETLKNRIDKS